MNKCRLCYSYAINPHSNGREEAADLDLCDVCYWRTRAEAAHAKGKAWKDAVIDVLVIGNILTKDHEDDPRKALHDLICWEIQIALDPAVSSDAQALIDKGREEGLREAQRLINLTDLGKLSGLPEQIWIAQLLLAISNTIEQLLEKKK